MPSLSGSTKANGAQPIATMHCVVIFLQGNFPGAGVVAISMQSMPDIDASIEPMLIGAGTIAIAVDWPIKPNRAISNNPICSERVIVRT